MRLVPALSQGEATLQVGGQAWKTEEGSEGDVFSLFLIDMRLTFDPDDDEEDLDFTVTLRNGGETVVIADGVDDPTTIDDESVDTEQCPEVGADGDPPGVQDNRCRVVRGSITSARPLLRGFPLPLEVKARDPRGHYDIALSDEVSIVILDIHAVPVAGPDNLVTLADTSCTPASADPTCRQRVWLDAVNSYDLDLDFLTSTSGLAVRNYCWQVVVVDDADCAGVLDLLAVTPVDAAFQCPPDTGFPAGCQWGARALEIQAFAGPVAGAAPEYRLQLRVEDLHVGWSAPDPVAIKIGPTPVWATSREGSFAWRIGTGSLHQLPDSFPFPAAFSNGAHSVVAAGGDDSPVATVVVVDGGLQRLAIDEVSDGGATVLVATTSGNPVGQRGPPSRVMRRANSIWMLWPDNSWAAWDGSTFTSGALSLPDGVVLDVLDVLPDGSALATTAGYGQTLLRLRPDGSPPEDVGLLDSSVYLSIEVGSDGRVYALAQSFIEIEGGGSGQLVILDAGLAVLPDVMPGFEFPDAARYLDGGTLETFDDGILVNDATTGLWYVAPDVSYRFQLSEPIGPAQALRVADDFSAIWIALGDAIVRIDYLDGGGDSFELGGVLTGLTGLSDIGTLVATIRTGPARGEALRLGKGSQAFSAPELLVRDACVDARTGGAWVAGSSYFQADVLAMDSTGAVPAAGFGGALVVARAQSLGPTVGTPTFVEPRHVARSGSFLFAFDSRTGGVLGSDLDQGALLLASVPPLGPDLPALTWDKRTDFVGQLSRLRGGRWPTDADPVAWGFGTEMVAGTAQTGVFVFQADATPLLAQARFDTAPLAGPAVDARGDGWVAHCQAASDPLLDVLAPCPCPVGNVDCAVGIRLGRAAPGDAAFAEWAVPSADLGACLPGTRCSLIPLDVAFDTRRDVLWMAAIDHGVRVGVAPAPFGPTLALFRIRCGTGGPLDTCAVADREAAVLTSRIRVSLSLDAGTERDLYEQTPNLLGIDVSSGEAWVLDPIAHRLHVFRMATDGVTIERAGFLDVPGMTGIAVER